MANLITACLLAFVFGYLLVSTYRTGDKLEGANVPLDIIYLTFIIFAVCKITISVLNLINY